MRFQFLRQGSGFLSTNGSSYKYKSSTIPLKFELPSGSMVVEDRSNDNEVLMRFLRNTWSAHCNQPAGLRHNLWVQRLQLNIRIVSDRERFHIERSLTNNIRRCESSRGNLV